MVAIIPVPLGPPLFFVFVPPAMPTVPAVLARLVQVVACPVGLFALRAMMFNRFMQAVIRPLNPALAIVIVRPQLRYAAEG
ncbi:MAG TPA: hypothetical protein VFA40_15895 [Terriglobales bacterium]|nr:hypothetical protein [Terriglobales bacterium]